MERRIDCVICRKRLTNDDRAERCRSEYVCRKRRAFLKKRNRAARAGILAAQRRT